MSEENDSVTDTENLTITISDSVNINDDYYKKHWNKLNIVHKKIKIKEFINNLEITKVKKKELIEILLKLLNNKKLNKNENIEYDNINGKIISIPMLNVKIMNILSKYIYILIVNLIGA